MKIIFSALVVTMSSTAFAADGGSYIRIENPASVHCGGMKGIIGSAEFTIRVNHEIVLNKPGSNDEMTSLWNQCQLAQVQAVKDGSALMIEVNSGRVLPEDGFFVRTQ